MIWCLRRRLEVLDDSAWVGSKVLSSPRALKWAKSELLIYDWGVWERVGHFLDRVGLLKDYSIEGDFVVSAWIRDLCVTIDVLDLVIVDAVEQGHFKDESPVLFVWDDSIITLCVDIRVLSDWVALPDDEDIVVKGDL